VCGTPATPWYANVKSRGLWNCSVCPRPFKARKVDPLQAAETIRSAGVEPEGPYPGPDAKWPGACRGCGARVTPTYANVRMGRGLVRRAAQSGAVKARWRTRSRPWRS
jgi:hypothetical protein